MRRLAAFIFVIMFSAAGWLCADEGAPKEEEVIELADAFIGDGVLGRWEGRRAGSREYAATANVASATLPAVRSHER